MKKDDPQYWENEKWNMKMPNKSFVPQIWSNWMEPVNPPYKLLHLSSTYKWWHTIKKEFEKEFDTGLMSKMFADFSTSVEFLKFGPPY